MPVSYRFISVDEECCNLASSSVDDISLSPSPQHSSCFNLLQQFYDELMIPTFASSQRDDINDWYECFRMQIKLHRHQIYIQKQKDIRVELINGLQEEGVASKIQQFAYCNDIEEKACECNPVMDVILMVVDDKEAEDNNKQQQIIGGAVVEYYEQSRVGLLSYIVLHNQYRGCGLAKSLHHEALSRLEVLANNYGTGNMEDELSSQDNNSRPLLQAIFAETNTVAAGDATTDQCLIRHKSLYNLGYRLVHFPYAPPPLSTKDVDASFHDIVLLVYFPMNDDQLKQNDLHNREVMKRYCQWFLEKDTENNTAQMNVEIPFHFIEEFFQVVFGLNTDDGLPDYRTSKYYCLAKQFSTQNRLVAIIYAVPVYHLKIAKNHYWLNWKV